MRPVLKTFEESFEKKALNAKILFQIPRLSVRPLSIISQVIPPANKFGPQAPPEELDSTQAVGTF